MFRKKYSAVHALKMYREVRSKEGPVPACKAVLEYIDSFGPIPDNDPDRALVYREVGITYRMLSGTPWGYIPHD